MFVVNSIISGGFFGCILISYLLIHPYLFH